MTVQMKTRGIKQGERERRGTHGTSEPIVCFSWGHHVVQQKIKFKL